MANEIKAKLLTAPLLKKQTDTYTIFKLEFQAGEEKLVGDWFQQKQNGKPMELIAGQEYTITKESGQYGLNFKIVLPQSAGGGNRPGNNQWQRPAANLKLEAMKLAVQLIIAGVLKPDQIYNSAGKIYEYIKQ